MNIGLLADNTPKFPSLPLMKISAYHKARGDLSNNGLHCNFQFVTGVSKIVAFPDYLPPPNCSAYKKRIARKPKGVI